MAAPWLRPGCTRSHFFGHTSQRASPKLQMTYMLPGRYGRTTAITLNQRGLFVTKLGSLLFVIAVMAGCPGPGPKPLEPPTPPQDPQPGPPEFQAVQSSHGAIFAWSKHESFLLFQGATDAESQKAALDDLSKSHQACQSPPCGEPLPAATIQKINDTFANQTEQLLPLGNHQVWMSESGDQSMIRWTVPVGLPDIIQLLPCHPTGDCGPGGPCEPPGIDCREFRALGST